MTNEELIEELLFEAEALGLREKILAHANHLQQVNPKMSPVVSYEKAYHQIVTKDQKK
jgi:hypothetical protein